MLSVDRNGYRLHARQDGATDKPAVLLLNSLGTDLRVWDPLLPHLPADYRYIRFDKPGHGLSDAPPPPYRMSALAADAAAVLDAFEAPHALIVGLSIGGQIALGLAQWHAERVRALALLDTGHRIARPRSGTSASRWCGTTGCRRWPTA